MLLSVEHFADGFTDADIGTYLQSAFQSNLPIAATVPVMFFMMSSSSRVQTPSLNSKIKGFRSELHGVSSLAFFYRVCKTLDKCCGIPCSLCGYGGQRGVLRKNPGAPAGDTEWEVFFFIKQLSSGINNRNANAFSIILLTLLCNLHFSLYLCSVLKQIIIFRY